jgi:Putative zinc-finger
VSSHPAERLSAFLDGELSAADRAQVESHLRECPACAHELEELAAVDAFAREVPVQAPDGYFEALPARVRARVRRPSRIPRPALWAVAAAAAVMAVVVTPVVLQREGSVMAPTAPVAQAVPQGPVPATLAASMAPAPPSFAQPADADRGARPLSPAKSEVRGRLQEREEADKPAQNALTRQKTADQFLRRDAPAAAPIVLPPATAAPAPLPASAAAASRAAAAGFEDRAAAPEPKVQAETVEVQTAATAERAAESGADARKEGTRPAQRKLAAGSGASHPDDRALMTDKRYEALLARPATSAAEARALRDAWDLFAHDLPADARADEARVRAIEAGVLAWTLGHDPADLSTARARGRAYLQTENAPQAARVRAALEALP